jgi:hypothetical protein
MTDFVKGDAFSIQIVGFMLYVLECNVNRIELIYTYNTQTTRFEWGLFFQNQIWSENSVCGLRLRYMVYGLWWTPILYSSILLLKVPKRIGASHPTFKVSRDIQRFGSFTCIEGGTRNSIKNWTLRTTLGNRNDSRQGTPGTRIWKIKKVFQFLTTKF